MQTISPSDLGQIIEIPFNLRPAQPVEAFGFCHQKAAQQLSSSSQQLLLPRKVLKLRVRAAGRPTFSTKFLTRSSAAAGATSVTSDQDLNAHSNMSLKLIPKKSLHVSTPTWWLESRFHFSFAEYFNPANQEFGVLRVLNDDIVKPRAGFGTHPHRDMEIVTYVVDGQLTHRDSMGTGESLGRGSVQYMSAGRGVTHSEMNDGDKPLKFLQIWIKPDQRGLTPNYGSRVFRREERHNKMHHVVTSFNRLGSIVDVGKGVIPIHQDANFYVSEMDPGFSQDFMLSSNRQAYMVCIEGGLSVNGTTGMEARDAVEVVAPSGSDFPLQLKADSKHGAHVLLIEMARS